MSELDQVIVCLWFLPVVLFIVIPLCVGFVWLVFHLFKTIFHKEVLLKDQYSPANDATRSVD